MGDLEVKADVERVLTEMLPDVAAVSEALDEYHAYHRKQGAWSSPLNWIRAQQLSPADFLAGREHVDELRTEQRRHDELRR